MPPQTPSSIGAVVTQPRLIVEPQWGGEEDLGVDGFAAMAFAECDVPCLWSVECVELPAPSAAVTFTVETGTPRGILEKLVFTVASLDNPVLQVDALRGLIRLVVWGSSVRVFAKSGGSGGTARVKLSPGSVAFGSGVGGGGALSPTRTADTALRSDVAQNAASVVLVSALNGPNSHRGCLIHNDAAANLHVRLGSAAASLADFSFIIPPQMMWEMPYPFYIGEIRGIWSAAGGGAARITQLAET